MLSCVSGFLPTNIANINIFFTINALLEYYFFNYKEIATFSQAVKRRRTISRPPTNVHSQNSFFNLITVEIPTLSILAIFLTG